MVLFIRNFASIQNMPSFERSGHHWSRPICLIKIWRFLLWRTQNPIITRNLWILGHSPQWESQWPSIWIQYNFATPKVVLRPEVRFWESLVLKWNQFYEKRASKQPQETKYNFYMIFDWKWTNMRQFRPYWPQKASELQNEFWVRQSKIHQILIRLLVRLLWWSDLKN